MKCKRNPLGEIVKCKALSCAHGGQTVQGLHCDKTHAPVVTWMTIGFPLILSLAHGWHTRQIDFVLACPQAKVSHDACVLIPEKFRVQHGKLVLDQDALSPWKQRCKLKLPQNLHGLKDAGATWCEHLKKGLIERGVAQSEVDPCPFFKKDPILIAHVDDCVLVSPNKKNVNEFIESMKKDCTLEDEGDVHAHLGIDVA